MACELRSGQPKGAEGGRLLSVLAGCSAGQGAVVNMRELVVLAWGNVGQGALRTALTCGGVMVGSGALVSMVSFGTGRQTNMPKALTRMEGFTTIRVLPRHGAESGMWGSFPMGEGPALTDSVFQLMAALPGVEMTYAEVPMPVKLRVRQCPRSTMTQVVPVVAGRCAPFQTMARGRFSPRRRRSSAPSRCSVAWASSVRILCWAARRN